MKLYSFNYDTEIVIQVFVSQDESQNTETIRKINVLKNLYSNISIFISGNSDTLSVFKEMLEYHLKINK